MPKFYLLDLFDDSIKPLGSFPDAIDAENAAQDDEEYHDLSIVMSESSLRTLHTKIEEQLNAPD